MMMLLVGCNFGIGCFMEGSAHVVICRLNELRDHERQNPLNSTLLPITYSCMYILCYYIFKKIRWNKIGVDC